MAALIALGVLSASVACGESDSGSDNDESGTGGGGSSGAAGSSGADGASSGSSGGGSSGSSSGASSSSGNPDGEVRAFPGAEGFGAMVTGGRGGRVIKVTTLAASGPGSLQAALDEQGARIIVFAVSGVIEADPITIRHGDVTVAGQTAPGAGITIRGRFYTDYDQAPSNIVVRHLRVRPVYTNQDTTQFDAIQFSTAHHFILDHVSVSGGADETVDAYEAHDATVQWSTIESSAAVIQPGDDTAHNYGLINGPDGERFSVHHTLFAHHRVRAPAIANGPAEIVHNVVYNGRRGFVHNNPANGAFHFIGNTFVDGPSDTLAAFYFDPENGTQASLQYFFRGNVAEGAGGACGVGPVDNPWEDCSIGQDANQSALVSEKPVFTGDAYREVRTNETAAARAAVVARAGAFPRDFITRRSFDELAAGTGEYGHRYANDSDFLAGLTPGSAPADADNDGIADDWEASHGLSSSDPADAATIMPGGYDALETYLNEQADNLLP